MLKKIFIGTFVMLAVFIGSQVSSAQENPPESDSTVVDGSIPDSDTTTVEGDSFVPDADTTTVEGDSFVPDADTTTVEGDSSPSDDEGEESSNNNGGGSTTSGGGSGGGSTSHAGSIVDVSGGFSSVPTNPTVLGASTGPEGETLMCAPYITTFMRMGKANDVEEVKKLQRFLNEFNDAKLPVTGFFGPLTDKAVKDLQTKYANEILKPWDEAGLSSNLQATGFVYKTTVWFINSHKCPEAQTPFPVLN